MNRAKRLALAGLSTVLLTIALSACRASGERDTVPFRADAAILLFNGTGTSTGDVAALQHILDGEHLDYSTADSSQLNGISESQFGQHRLLIVPGGNFVQIGDGLSANAAANIRRAVQGGLNYLGICAGAFFAGSSPYNGLNLTSGRRFGFYSAEVRGIRKAAVAIVDAGGQTLDQYWEDGPELTGWGDVVGRYPDGTPAIAQGTFGSGWVLLTGVHPEAPATWRRGMEFRTPLETDTGYAVKLIRAALNREPLAHF